MLGHAAGLRGSRAPANAGLRGGAGSLQWQLESGSLKGSQTVPHANIQRPHSAHPTPEGCLGHGGSWSKGSEVGNDPVVWGLVGLGGRPAVLGRTLRAGEHGGAVGGQDIFQGPPGHPTGDGGKGGGDEQLTLGGGRGDSSRARRHRAGQAKKQSSFQKEGDGQVSPTVPRGGQSGWTALSGIWGVVGTRGIAPLQGGQEDWCQEPALRDGDRELGVVREAWPQLPFLR